MAVDTVSGGAVDAARVVTGSSPFDVDTVILSAAGGYQGYQYLVQWDPAVLAYEGRKDLKPAGLELCASVDATENTAYGGCARTGDTTTDYTGPVDTLTFHCVADGTSTLHLVTLTDDPDFGSTALGFGGLTIETTLNDASVTCQGTG